MSSAPVRSLFVTLKRSTAGTPHHHVSIIKSLGFRHREHTIERTNTASMRGAINKIRHLLLVETDIQRAARLAAEAEATKLRPPVVVQHTRA